MRGKVVAAVLAVTVGTATVGGAALVVIRSGEALPGTSVAGIELAGLDRDGVREVVERLVGERTTGTLAITAAGLTAPLERSVTTADVDATVDQALSAGRDSWLARLFGPLFGPAFGAGDRSTELVLTVDEPALAGQLAALAGRVDRAPAVGGFTVAGTVVTAEPPAAGRVLDRRAAARAVSQALLDGRQAPLDLPVTVIPAATTATDVAEVVAAATRALSGSYSLGAGALTITPTQLAPLLRAKADGDRLLLRVDNPGLAALVTKQARIIDLAPREASFAVASTGPTVTEKGDLTWTPLPAEVRVRPGAAGRAVDVQAATARLTELVLAGERNLARVLPVRTVQPELTTAAAQGARVRTLIGSFTTAFTAGQPRAQNIRRIAEIVDGAYVAPGEVFSLNQTAGERTRARGFVADAAIVDGELTDEVGGGVSQFATTLFNAAFFAGLPILEHKPHSFYISRYPAGRESTVYFGALDVKFKNDTGNGVLVKTHSTPGSVTVELYGDNGGRQVSSTTGPRQPRPDGGFRIAVTRTVSGGDNLSSRRVFTSTYAPAPASH